MNEVTIPLPRPVSWHQSHEQFKGFSKRGDETVSKSVTIRFLPDEYKLMAVAAATLGINHGNYIRQVVAAVSEKVLEYDDDGGSG